MDVEDGLGAEVARGTRDGSSRGDLCGLEFAQEGADLIGGDVTERGVGVKVVAETAQSQGIVANGMGGASSDGFLEQESFYGLG